MKKLSRFHRTKLTLLIVLGFLVLLAASGAVYQLVSVTVDMKSYPAPGRLIEIGNGRLMHLNCTGQGQPTVILESATDMFSSDWFWIQQELAPLAQVCSYDRAGQGWSSSASGSRDADHIADELHTLIGKAELNPPFLLVGHSVGGLFVELYAAKYPETVSGMVLIDPGNEYFLDRIPGFEEQMRKDKDMVSMLKLASYVGLPRLMGVGEKNAEGLPDRQAAEVNAFVSRSRHWEYVGSMIDALPATYDILKKTSLPVNIPLTIVSGGKAWLDPDKPKDEMRTAINGLHAETAGQYADGRHMVIEEASHGSLLHNRNHASIVAKVIADRIK